MLNNNRVFGLDIMRAVAIMAVLHDHLGVFLDKPEPFKFDGVGIFFVLSGYLIGGILLNAINKPVFSSKHLLDFWVRRWMRTLPAYYIVLTYLVIFSNPNFRIWYYTPSQIWLYYFFVQSVFNGALKFFPESWSLPVEEWFYLLIPILFFIGFKCKFTPKKIVLTVVVCIIAAGFLLKLFIYNTADLRGGNTWDNLLRKATVPRLDSIMFGVLAAYIKHYKHLLWQKLQGTPFLFLGLILLVASTCMFFLKAYIGLPLIGFISLYLNTIGALLVLPPLSNVTSGKGIIYQTFTFISKISYSIYLLNLNAFFITWPYINHLHFRLASWLHISQAILYTKGYYYYYHNFWYFLFAIGGAYILYSLVEKPFMGLRNKLKIV